MISFSCALALVALQRLKITRRRHLHRRVMLHDLSVRGNVRVSMLKLAAGHLRHNGRLPSLSKFRVHEMRKLVPLAKLPLEFWPSFWLRSDVVCPARGQPIPCHRKPIERRDDLGAASLTSPALKGPELRNKLCGSVDATNLPILPQLLGPRSRANNNSKKRLRCCMRASGNTAATSPWPAAPAESIN